MWIALTTTMAAVVGLIAGTFLGFVGLLVALPLAVVLGVMGGVLQSERE